jgi:hypothetical protein
MKTLAATCACLLLSLSAQAEECNNTSWSALAATACRGALAGELTGSATELSYLGAELGGSWSYAGRSNDAGNGPFTGNPQVLFAGSVGFDAPQLGSFIVAMKAGDNHSFYRFDTTTPISQLVFDSTEGVAVTPQGNPLPLDYLVLYQAAAVPEPQTALMLLAGAALLVRRRGQTARQSR